MRIDIDSQENNHYNNLVNDDFDEERLIFVAVFKAGEFKVSVYEYTKDIGTKDELVLYQFYARRVKNPTDHPSIEEYDNSNFYSISNDVGGWVFYTTKAEIMEYTFAFINMHDQDNTDED